MHELIQQDSINIIDKKLADEPIVLPESPFWEVFKDFGKDELIALLINVIGVSGLAVITKDPLLLSIIGPVIEKVGFFVSSSHEAVQRYRTTPEEDREQRAAYLMDAVKNGLPNLLKDIAFHDPLYTALMLASLERFPDTSVWMLSMIAFLLSIAAVTTGEVATKELLYLYQKNQLEKKGFSLEQHLESRFAVKAVDPTELMSHLASYFSLGEVHTSTYLDQYYPTQLRPYNARTPIVRVRERTEGGAVSRKMQVVYTKAAQVNGDTLEQYNYYPVSKDKFSLEIEAETRPNFTGLAEEGGPHTIRFMRMHANVPQKMLISVDLVDQAQPYTVVEIKSFRDNKEGIEAMITAMQYVMSHYDVIQTTHSKRVLTDLKT